MLSHNEKQLIDPHRCGFEKTERIVVNTNFYVFIKIFYIFIFISRLYLWECILHLYLNNISQTKFTNALFLLHASFAVLYQTITGMFV